MPQSSTLKQLIRTWSKCTAKVPGDEQTLSSTPTSSFDDSSTFVSLTTASLSSSSTTKWSSYSSIKERWEALALHRFFSPKTCARETIPLSQVKLTNLLRSLPAATTTIDRCGRTPLHLACSNRFVTPAMISMLLAAPGGKNALTMKDNIKGYTPLHYTIICHQDANIISRLVEANPHITTIRDDFAGMTPLHHACEHLASISSSNLMSVDAPTMSLLLRGDPSIALARDHNGNTPFSLVCQKFDSLCRHGTYSAAGRPRVVTFGSFLFLERSLPIFRAIALCRSGNVGAHLAKETNQDIDSSWDDMLLDVLLAVKSAVGSNEVMVSNRKITYEFAALAVIHRCKDQALALDSNGNTPLHIAASIPAVPLPAVSRLLYPSTDKCVVRDKCIVDYLVRICPEAAQKRNQDGRLPFHNIVEGRAPSWKYGVTSILGANPDAVTELDIDSRLYPNLLDRVGKNAGVGAVFSILREKPELVMVGSSGGTSLSVEAKGSRLRVRRLRRK